MGHRVRVLPEMGVRVPKVTTVEHIKGPADNHLLPGERTADRVTETTRPSEKRKFLR